MSIKKSDFVLMGAIVFLVASTAQAVTLIYPPAAGRPYYALGNQPDYSSFDIDNSYVCSNIGMPNWYTWIPLQDKTSGNVTVVQEITAAIHSSGAVAGPRSKAYTFTPSGNFHAATGWAVGVTSIGTVSLPSNGTLMVLSQLDGSNLLASSCVKSFRVTW
jgi:hypothetical protein